MTVVDRRALVAGLGASAALVHGAAWAQDAPAPFTELQHGDPGAPYESVTVDPTLVRQLSSGEKRATFNPRNATFETSLLSTARRFLGMDRTKNKIEIAGFLDLFGLPFKDGKGEFVPYCACGVAYAAALSYREFWSPGAPAPNITQLRESLPETERYHFYPSPSVADMYYVARGKRRWKDASDAANRPTPKPGWIVIYSFDREADHCGIVESVDGSTLQTIEFNTSNGLQGDQRNGGMVTRRKRDYGGDVMGFIATDMKT